MDDAPVPKSGRERERTRFSLLDALGLVAGYGLASLLVRAYWPKDEAPGVWVVAMTVIVFAWLGLAMSGPVLLLTRKPPQDDPADDRPAPRTWAEMSWILIGVYWTVLTVLVAPARLNGGRFLDTAVLGVFPILAALAVRWLAPRTYWARRKPAPGAPTWTHDAGVALLLTWPFAWLGLILLGNAL